MHPTCQECARLPNPNLLATLGYAKAHHFRHQQLPFPGLLAKYLATHGYRSPECGWRNIETLRKLGERPPVSLHHRGIYLCRIELRRATYPSSPCSRSRHPSPRSFADERPLEFRQRTEHVKLQPSSSGARVNRVGKRLERHVLTFKLCNKRYKMTEASTEPIKPPSHESIAGSEQRNCAVERWPACQCS